MYYLLIEVRTRWRTLLISGKLEQTLIVTKIFVHAQGKMNLLFLFMEPSNSM